MWKKLVRLFSTPKYDFLLVAVIFPSVVIMAFEPNKWLSIGAVAYCGIIGSLYASARWLEGLSAGLGSKDRDVMPTPPSEHETER